MLIQQFLGIFFIHSINAKKTFPLSLILKKWIKECKHRYKSKIHSINWLNPKTQNLHHRNLQWHSCQVYLYWQFYLLILADFSRLHYILLVWIVEKTSSGINSQKQELPKGWKNTARNNTIVNGVTCFPAVNASDTWIPSGGFNDTTLAHEKVHLRGRLSFCLTQPLRFEMRLLALIHFCCEPLGPPPTIQLP